MKSIKRINYIIFSILFILCTTIPVNAVSDYWKNIHVKFNTCEIGYNSDEDSWNTNKVKLFNADETEGKFYIGTHNVWNNDAYNLMQYISLNNQLAYGSTSQMDDAARFMLFEYVEKNIISVSQIDLKASLCDVLELDNITNPNTGREVVIIIIIFLVVVSCFIKYERSNIIIN